MKKDIQEIKRKAVPLLKKYGVVKAGIFGSYARGEQNKKSDVDMLIQVRRKKFSLFDLIDLEEELKKKLGKEVDLLTYNGINHLLRDRILEEEIRII
jgi:uncharacterized protein